MKQVRPYPTLTISLPTLAADGTYVSKVSMPMTLTITPIKRKPQRKK